MWQAIFGSVLSGIDGILDKFVEDKGAEASREAELLKERLKLEVLKIQQEHAAQLAQIEVNKQASQHGSIFVAGARPFFLWVTGAAFAYTFVVQPLLVFLVQVGAKIIGGEPLDLTTLPELDWSVLMPAVVGLLGLGGMRSWEKSKGVDTKTIGTTK
jgi:hypothetical protein